MPLRKRFKRPQTKAKAAHQALRASGGPATSTTSLPNVLITLADNNDLSTPYIGGTRTSAPTPDPPSRTQSPSPDIRAVSPPEPNPDHDATRATTLLPHMPAILPSLIHASSSRGMGNETSAQPPDSWLGSHQSPPSGGVMPKLVTVTQDDPSQTPIHAKNLSPNDPSMSPASDAASKSRNDPSQVPPTQPNPQATPGDASPINESIIAIHESNIGTEPPTTVPRNAQTPTWECLNRFRQVLKGVSGGFGPVRPVIEGLSDCLGIYEGAMQSRQDYETLKGELESLFSLLSEHFSGHVPPKMTTAMNNLCTAIETELDHISIKQSRGRFRQCQEANKDLDDVMQCYRRVHAHLERLKLNADLSRWKIVDELAVETRLKSLLIGPVLAACYDSAEARELGRRECTPETRKQVLRDLSHWRHDRKAGNIYWLNGMAGTGKTTIASSLCAMLERSHELGASFFCSRLLPHCRDIKLILPAIAYQIACYSYPFRNALSLVLQQEPNLHSKSLPKQLEGLLIKPLRSVAHALPADMVVVVDALDECEDSRGVSLFLEILVKRASGLPIKVFVSSRPEPQIRQNIGDIKSQLILHELEQSVVREDIKLYLRTELMGLVPSISEADLVVLTDRAGVLFIYAATVVRFVSSASVQRQPKRVQDVLELHELGHPSQNKAIDMLYDTILVSAFNNSDLLENEKAITRLVLDTVVCAQEPLTIAAMTGLLGLQDKTLVQAGLEPLWSVLHVAGGDGTVTTLHTSFPEYMLDPTRSKEHGCQAGKHHKQLADLCFKRIKSNKSQFNICRLESSFVLDEQVPDLEERLTRAIPRDLMYACQYWVSHLELGGSSTESLEQLYSFLSERLLLWIEVLNLRKKALVATSMLSKAEAWCKAADGPHEVKRLVHDAWRFTTVFATSNASRSTPHLYVSMLALWASVGGLLGESYACRTRGLVCVEGTGLARQQFALLSTFSVHSRGVPVAFSPNGIHAASEFDARTLRVWNVASGKPVMDLIKGHEKRINSIAFSSDGTRIASSSHDSTIMVWDVTSGKPVMARIKGHESFTNRIAYSPDGTRFVYGSEDGTLQLRDTTSGNPVMTPIKGDYNLIKSIAFSPDGTRIAPGSGDGALWVWDATSGNPVMTPIEGDYNLTKPIALSPDGTRIASGSGVGVLWVWDATSGNPVMTPIEGDYNLIKPIAFSPDGTRIASGSEHGALRVWDATSGKPVMVASIGHNKSINSIAFSPDGTRIVSGSHDRTLRVWDATSGRAVTEPLRGHTGSVNSVAFSSDGMRIVSGSEDRTILVWDATTGKKIVGPFEGHTDSVTSVVFSPDDMRITSGSDDSTICTWDSASGKALMGLLESPTHWSGLVPLLATSTRIISNFSDAVMCLWSSTKLRPLPELATDCTASVIVFSSPFNGVQNPLPSLQRVTRIEPQWRLTGDILEALVKLQVAPGWDVPTSTRWAHSLLVFSALRLLFGSEWGLLIFMGHYAFSRWARVPEPPDSLRVIERLVDAFRNSACDRSSLCSALLTLGQICAFAPIQCLAFIDILLSDVVGCIVLRSYSGAMWIQDSTRVPGVAQVFRACLRLLIILLAILYICGFSEYENQITSVVSSLDGTRTASGYSNGQVHIRDTRNRLRAVNPRKCHAGWVTSLAFSPDGARIASGSSDQTIRVWDATSGKLVLDTITGHRASVSSIAFSPDGKRIASGSEDSTVRVWDVTNERPVMGPITGHTKCVNEVAFSPDGTRIVSGSDDMTIRVWDATNGKQIIRLCTRQIDSVRSVTFLSDNARIASLSGDRTLRLWDTRMPKVKHNFWTLNEEGWVVNDEGHLLLWLPADLRRRLLPPRNLYSISTRDFVALNFDGANIGESWAECYVCA